MRNVLESLHRLREHARLEAELSLREAERAQELQQARIDSLQTGVRAAQAAVDPEDALGLVAYQSFRLREEMRERRERARLQQKQRDVSVQEDRFVRCVRDELSMQAVIDEKQARADEDARRDEARKMDEIAGRVRRVVA